MATRKPSKRRRPASVSLAHRLPNPPAVWVGRDADIDWLARAIERAPVTLVTGPGGVGKTALVQKTLHTRLERRVERTVFVDIPVGQPAAQVRQDILKAVASATGETALDWPSLQADAMTALSAILDLAEASELTVVIDDLHQSEVDEIDTLLTTLASFSKRSRYVATSRLTPRLPVLAGQILALSAMPDRDLVALAEMWAPHADPNVMRRSIAAASGSPWLLSQLLVTGSSERDLEQGGLLSGLDDRAADFLRALSIVDVPLPVDVLALVSPHPGEDVLRLLERRGLTTASTGGLRLHDVARGLLARHGSEDEARIAHAAAVLGQADLLDAKLEAVRLFARLGRMEAVAGLLDQTATRWFAHGHTPRLFKILKDLADPAVDAWKLRCAAELGNPTALAQVYAPSRDDAAETLAWARTLRASGDPADAARQLGALLATSAEPAIRNEATRLLATCLCHMGRFDEASTTIAALVTGDPSLALARDVSAALADTLAGETPIDRLLALRARALLDHPPVAAPLAGAIMRELAEAFAAIGMMAEAADLAARARPEAARPDLLANRESILASATIALDRGDLLEARRLADAVRPFARGSSILLPSLQHVDVARRLAAGELDGLAPLIDAYASEAHGIDARTDVELVTLKRRLNTIFALADAASLKGDADAHAHPRVVRGGRASRPDRGAREAILFESIAAVRLSATEPSKELVSTAYPSADKRLACIVGLLDATVAIVAGDVARAVSLAREAAARAARAELRLLEAEARLVALDALSMAGRAAELLHECEQLGALARAMRSARYEREIVLADHLARGSRISSAALQKLAASEHVAPVAARRARALLGSEPRLDHVDLRVLESVAAADIADTYVPIGSGDDVVPTADDDMHWASAWGIDGKRGTVWLGDGRTIDFSAKPQLFRILEALAQRGGSASKEALVTDAWGEPAYHPLRHDGKLHVAVRKLREQIEDEPASPKRLATTEEGYALAGTVRFVPGA